MQERGRSRRTFLVLLTTLAVAMGACSNGGSATSTPGGGGGASSAAPGESGGAAGSGAAGFSHIGGTVTVVGSWTGSEQDSFMAMVKPWEDATGVQVNYSGSRDLAAQLTAGIASGNLPDVAGLPGPGLMKEWYNQGALKPLDFVDFAKYESDTPPGFAAAGKADDGKLIGIFTKAAVKGLIWYNTAVVKDPKFTSFDQLQATNPSPAEALWCVGFASGAASGWPGTDWIEDIVLRQSGPDVYDRWVKGQQKWTSPEIKSAFETFKGVIDKSFKGSDYIVTTSFDTAGNPLFTNPPGCMFHHQASFITDFFMKQGGAKEGDFDFFVMPDINPQFAGSITTAGDLFGMFNDTPQAESLIQWLLTPQAQEIWAKRGGFISMNRNVPADVYPDAASKKSAEILQNAKNARFDGSDQMPNAMNDAFFKAMMDFARDPGNLDSILQNLDTVQADAYQQ